MKVGSTQQFSIFILNYIKRKIDFQAYKIIFLDKFYKRYLHGNKIKKITIFGNDLNNLVIHRFI